MNRIKSFFLAAFSVFVNFLLGLDQTLNTLVWLKSEGFGLADEALSARAWRLRADSHAYKVINALFFWQKNHCKAAYESEMQRKHLPKEYRKREGV